MNRRVRRRLRMTDGSQTALLSVAQMTEADRAAIAAGTPGSVLMQNAGERRRAGDHPPLVASARDRSVRPRQQRRRRLRRGRRTRAGRLAGPGRLARAQGKPARRRASSCGALERQHRDRDSRRDRWRGAGRRCPVWVRPQPRVGRRKSSPRWAPWRSAATAGRGRCAERRDGRHRRERGRGAGRLHRHLRAQEARSCCCCRAASCAAKSWSRISAFPPPCSNRCPSIPGRTIPPCGATQLPRAKLSGNKYTRGHALLCGGYPMTGAARMAARAAARVGAGLTTIAVPEAAFSLYAAALTSIMVQPAEPRRRLGAAAVRPALHGVLDRARRRRQRRHPRNCARDAGEPRGRCCSMRMRSASSPPGRPNLRKPSADPAS